MQYMRLLYARLNAVDFNLAVLDANLALVRARIGTGVAIVSSANANVDDHGNLSIAPRLSDAEARCSQPAFSRKPLSCARQATVTRS